MIVWHLIQTGTDKIKLTIYSESVIDVKQYYIRFNLQTNILIFDILFEPYWNKYIIVFGKIN